MAPPSRPVFGQTVQKKKGGGGGRSSYQRQLGGRGGGNSSKSTNSSNTVYQSGDKDEAAEKAAQVAEFRRKKLETAKQVETSFGLERFVLEENQQKATRRGWLYNLIPTAVRTLHAGCNGWRMDNEGCCPC